MQKKSLTLLGTAFHTPRRGKLEVLEDHLFHLDDLGAIRELVPPGSDAYPALKQVAAQEGSLIELSPGQILLPGLIDLHIHAPQWPQMGKALDVPLEVWLQTHTFPLEARFSDINFARTVYTHLVETLLANGTTTAVYFGSIHFEATLLLAEICKAKGQRALVGKVAMDHPEQCPSFYRDSDSQTSLALSEKFIDAVSALGLASGRHPLLLPVLTPRFVPSCTDATLAGLGALARHRESHIQTHCAESDWQSRFVKDRLGLSDPAALDRFGLLTRKTILAHGNFLESCDLERLSDRGSGVAHCPLSNIFFANAVFPLRDALDRGVHTGLGTDIAGGYSPSPFDSLRQAISASRLRQSGVDASLPPERRGLPASAIDHREAFWLATAGGAEVLDLALGRFAPGYAFDALVLDPGTAASNLFFLAGESREDQFQKLLLNATRANIVQTWVQGRRVFCQGAS